MEHHGRAERNRQGIQSDRVVKPEVGIYNDGSAYKAQVARQEARVNYGMPRAVTPDQIYDPKGKLVSGIESTPEG